MKVSFRNRRILFGKAAVRPEERPVIVLGTGRSGSTFQQVALSQLPDLWIWGENNGLVLRARDFINGIRTDDQLRRFSFQTPVDEIEATLSPDFAGDPNRVAWLCGFRPWHLNRIERELLIALFATGLPKGRRRWGFKEVRHGPRDGVAEHLLDIFPEGRIVHAVRHPTATIESSILSWERGRLAGLDDEAFARHVEATYRFYAERWATTNAHFLDLARREPRVFTSRLESFADDFAALLGFLEIPRRGLKPLSTRINPAATGVTPKLADLFAGHREATKPIVAAVAARLGYEV